MNNYITSVLVAVFLYATANVIIERYLGQFSSIGILIFMYPIMLGLAFATIGAYRASNTPVNAPVGLSLVALTLVVGAIYYFADWSYVNAYNKGGDVASITSIMVAFPVVAQLMKSALDQQMPTFRNIAGTAVIAGGVFIFFSDAKN